MHAERPTLVTSRLWVWFVLPILPVMGIYALYGLNIVWWRNSPDFGWRTMNSTGPNFVAEVMDSGEQAGLRVGDMVVAINGKPYWTFDDLFFGVRRQEPGSLNAYTVLRDGQRLEINIVTQPLGLKAALARSGPIFAVGLVYTLIGVLVFLMKPQAGESWLFLVMACFFGLEISLGAPSFLMAPLWLYDVRLLIEAALPAPLIHLALRFPKTRTFYRKRPWIWTIPYIIPTALFVAYKMTSTSYWDSPPFWTWPTCFTLSLGSSSSSLPWCGTRCAIRPWSSDCSPRPFVWGSSWVSSSPPSSCSHAAFGGSTFSQARLLLLHSS